jgi:hypothetical protein
MKALIHLIVALLLSWPGLGWAEDASRRVPWYCPI